MFIKEGFKLTPLKITTVQESLSKGSKNAKKRNKIVDILMQSKDPERILESYNSFDDILTTVDRFERNVTNFLQDV